MKFAGFMLFSSAICANITVEGKPKILSYSENKKIDQYLDDILDILAEEGTVSYKCTVYSWLGY